MPLPVYTVPRTRATLAASSAVLTLLFAAPGAALARGDARSVDAPGRVQRVDDRRVFRFSGKADTLRGGTDERPYAPAPLQPPRAVEPVSESTHNARGDGRMTIEERRRLRREIHEAGRDLYGRPR